MSDPSAIDHSRSEESWITLSTEMVDHIEEESEAHGPSRTNDLLREMRAQRNRAEAAERALRDTATRAATAESTIDHLQTALARAIDAAEDLSCYVDRDAENGMYPDAEKDVSKSRSCLAELKKQHLAPPTAPGRTRA